MGHYFIYNNQAFFVYETILLVKLKVAVCVGRAAPKNEFSFRVLSKVITTSCATSWLSATDKTGL